MAEVNLITVQYSTGKPIHLEDKPSKSDWATGDVPEK